MKAIHGGKAKNDKPVLSAVEGIDAHKIAVLLPKKYPDVAYRGMCSAPFPSPESNWTTLWR